MHHNFRKDSHICDGRVYKKRAWNTCIPSSLFCIRGHHRMAEATEPKQSEGEAAEDIADMT